MFINISSSSLTSVPSPEQHKFHTRSHISTCTEVDYHHIIAILPSSSPSSAHMGDTELRVFFDTAAYSVPEGENQVLVIRADKAFEFPFTIDVTVMEITAVGKCSSSNFHTMRRRHTYQPYRA